MQHKLTDLPFPPDALESFLSQETLFYHHQKHHAGYVKKLNELIKDTEYEQMSLEQIITQSDGAVFNNAAQTFNHNFYWNCLSPTATVPSDALLRKITDVFGSMEKLKEAFLNAALTNFGSGWTWLVLDQHEHLKIVNTSNAQTPIAHHETPLLTCDVWEHAYYLDYKNERAKYLDAFWEHINWENASKIFADKEHLNAVGLYGIVNNDPDDPMSDYLDELQRAEEISS
ncbi:superoxide dismutase [Sulfurimonas sp. SWIR-19]|uniref:superoxide dismutase n=1 Tax=Sulfurimonas sp. SWIR-19 TaxID=2878390 RepID=UPI001CF42971|nr:superoxide dismutase [Sulfurimonas sp. SWIR-19]UCN00284.1 superoxide dismutase [Sulfurimonas sp. SWIR-19]